MEANWIWRELISDGIAVAVAMILLKFMLLALASIAETEVGFILVMLLGKPVDIIDISWLIWDAMLDISGERDVAVILADSVNEARREPLPEANDAVAEVRRDGSLEASDPETEARAFDTLAETEGAIEAEADARDAETEAE